MDKQKKVSQMNKGELIEVVKKAVDVNTKLDKALQKMQDKLAVQEQAIVAMDGDLVAKNLKTINEVFEKALKSSGETRRVCSYGRLRTESIPRAITTDLVNTMRAAHRLRNMM